MKLNLAPLLGRARRITAIAVSSGVEVLVIEDAVDAETGEPAGISPDLLRGLSVADAAQVLHDRYAGDTLFVIRSASAFALVRPAFSELPVYYWPRGDKLDVWSGLEAPAVVAKRRPDFDLEYLTGTLSNMSWMTPSTGLNGVSELLSGAVLLWDGRQLRQRDLLAHTVNRLRADELTDYDARVSVFRQLILNSIRHKTGGNPHGFSVLCSGGVDSSVLTVAAGVLYPDRALALLNSYSEEDQDGDERFYFDAVASQVGGRRMLVETNSRSSPSDLSPDLLAVSTRPTKMSATVPTTSLLYEAAAANGSTTVLTGDGGDQLFLLNSPGLYSREVATEASTPAAALRALAGLAIRDRSQLWAIAGEVLQGRRARRYREHFFGSRRFGKSPIAAHAVPAGTDVVPNGSTLASLGVSRAFQYFGMRNAELNRVKLKECDVTERKPFVFWPLVRAAMMAPRQHHMAGGKDRALERDAFKAELPQVIYDRVGKGAGRNLIVRYDYETLAAGLLSSPVCRYRLVDPEHIRNITRSNIDHETALALVRARGIADWMEFYE